MPPRPRLWNAAIICSPTLAEMIGEKLEEEAVAVSVLAPPRRDTAQVDAIFTEEPDAAALTAQLALLAGLQNLPAPQITITEVGDLDWLKKVASDFPPLPIGRWTIYGAAHKDKIHNPRLALQIDATSAFGTGEHPTTRGCLLMLDELLKKRPQLSRLLDIGCGSGILAMGFTKARRARAIAVDMDPESVRIAESNTRINGLRPRLRTGKSLGTRAPMVARGAPYDLIMANIFARPLCLLAKDLRRHLRPGGHAILSGILNPQANAVIAAHRMQGLALRKRVRLGEWTVLVVERGRSETPHA